MFRVGAASVDITPDRPMFLYGYPHVPRRSTGTHDPLSASAVFLEDARGAALIVAVDILFVATESVARCLARLHAHTGIDQARVMISATHTHSGPVTAAQLAFRADPVVPPVDPAYLAFFEAQIVAAGVAAWKNRVPAEAAARAVRIEGVGGNRLDPNGAADREAGLLLYRRTDTKAPIAMHLVYSMHPTVLHEDSTLVSGDFPGLAKRRLVDAFPGLVPLYHLGPAGNQSPRYSVRAQTFDEAERLGAALAAPVIEAVRTLRDADFDRAPALAVARGTVRLEPRRFPEVAAAEANRAAKRAEFARLMQAGAGHGPVRTAECAVFGAEALVELARAQASGELEAVRAPRCHAELQAIRIGSVCLAGLPGELFVEYGLAIKRRAALPAFVISLANGELQGYIVTPEAEREGGYEAQGGFFAASSGARLVDAMVRLIGTLA